MKPHDTVPPSERKLNILLMGDASNFHRTLAEGLKRRGHNAVVASDGTFWMNTKRDIDLSRKLPGKLGGLQLWLKYNLIKQRKLSGYDIVSVNGPCFALLQPNRLQAIFDFLIAHNSHVFHTVLGYDSHFIESCIGSNPPLRYTEWKINGNPTPLMQSNEQEIKQWLSPGLYNLSHDMYNRTAGAVTALYEYQLTTKQILPESKIGYGGIPIDTPAIDYIGVNPRGRKVRMLLGYHAARMKKKGAERLLALAKKVEERYPDRCQLQVVENLPYNEYIKLLQSTDIVLDQIYSYTPATNALLAMAMGKTVVSGGEPEYYDFIGEYDNRPIINAVPDDDDALFRDIERAVLNPQSLIDNAPKNRDFVVKHNDTDIVTDRFLKFWQSRI